MMTFPSENFLLQTDVARELYFDFACDQPVYDYHSHLSVQAIAENRKFSSIAEAWLAGDHYKWRAMRANGIHEDRISGNASERDKFQAWAETVPRTIGNPLYHWSMLELRRPLDVNGGLLGPDTAEMIWQTANARLGEPNMGARDILIGAKMALVGTTDDPTISLDWHRKLSADPDLTVVPTWRADNLYKIESAGFAEYVARLSAATDVDIESFQSFWTAVERRLEYFHANGCRLADHGLDYVCYEECDEAALTAILRKRLAGGVVLPREAAAFRTAVQVALGREYGRRGWVMQLHIGAIVSPNTRRLAALGPNTGFDCMDDAPIVRPLLGVMNALEHDDLLPRTILYCANPVHQAALATLAGVFQGGGVAGKIQLGSGWWFNDQKDGMEHQLTQLAHIGLLCNFIGMLTDSRSFLSVSRHEYFRRILCNLIGNFVARGEWPNDIPFLGRMVSDICFGNARRYFPFSLKRGADESL